MSFFFYCFIETLLPSCETASRPACLKDNVSGLRNNTRHRLQSFLSNLDPVLNSSCSVKLRRLACFIETAPCVTNDGSTLHACPSMCQEVRRDCEEEFKKHNIDFPQCIPYHPEIPAGDGLCKLSRWPVPWPNTTGTQVLGWCQIIESLVRSVIFLIIIPQLCHCIILGHWDAQNQLRYCIAEQQGNSASDIF